MSLSRRTLLAAAAAVVLVIAYDVFALEVGAHTFFGASRSSVYNRLTDSLLHGRTTIDVKVPRGLLELPDPYDPAANRAYRDAGLHDYTLYNGKIYVYWGPVPALLVYAPAQLVGLTLADGHAVLLFAIAAFLASLALLGLLVRRLRAPPPPLALFAGAVALGFANLGPYLLSRPLQYEVAIAAGTFFVWLAALCFVAAIWSSRKLLLLGLGSLSVGLAVGCRATLALAMAMALPALWSLWRDAPSRSARLRTLAALAIPCGVILVALAAYNAVRFDSLTEFGTRWQLSDPQYRRGGYFTGEAFLPNLWNYVVPPPLVRAVFPFLFGNPDETSPLSPGSRYVHDAVVGLLWLAPLTAFAALAPRWLREAAPELRRAVAVLAIGLAVLFLPLMFLHHDAIRYETDFLSLLMAIAVIAWMTRLAARPGRGLLGLGVVLAAVGALVTALISLDNNQALREHHPGVLRSLESVTGPLSALGAGLAGHPILAAVDQLPAGPPYRYDRLGRDGTTVRIARAGTRIEIAASRSGRVRLAGRVTGGRIAIRGSRTPVLEVHRGVTRTTLVALGAQSVRVEGLQARWAD